MDNKIKYHMMEPIEDIVPVEVYAGTMWDAGMVKSLLEDAEIETFLLDENTGTLAPWYTAGGGAGSVRVVVSSLDYEKAKSIVVEFEKISENGDKPDDKS